MLDGLRRSLALIEHPPARLVDAVRAFDPDGDAQVIGGFLNTASQLDGRPFLAFRRPEWLALEDKTVVDALWDRAGVRRAPAVMVPAETGALASAASQVDAGDGTVWSGDTREGFNGGAEYVRWVRTAADAATATTFFGGALRHGAGDAVPRGHPVQHPRDRVRGARCGGPTGRDGHVASPARPSRGRLLLRRVRDASSTPRSRHAPRCRRSPARREACCDPRSDTAGAFTIDGVATSDGFLPTELNPRVGRRLERHAARASRPPRCNCCSTPSSPRSTSATTPTSSSGTSWRRPMTHPRRRHLARLSDRALPRRRRPPPRVRRRGVAPTARPRRRRW